MTDKAGLPLSTFANLGWDEMQTFNNDINTILHHIRDVLNGGNNSRVAILFYFVIGIIFGLTFTLQESTYNDLSKLTSCSANIGNSTGFFRILSYIGLAVCAIHTVFFTFFMDRPTDVMIKIELGVGIVLWVIFLIQMIMTLVVKNGLDNTSKCSTTNDDQKKILDAAKSLASRQLGFAVGGVLLTTLYVGYNGIRIYNNINGEHKNVETTVANFIKKFKLDTGLLSDESQTAKTVFDGNPDADPTLTMHSLGF
jgi:hypothetical protein